MKNIYLKILASFFIAIVFLSLLILSGYFLLINYKVFLKNFGIYVQDDCKFENSRILCGYIKVTDKKNFELNIKDLKAKIYLKNLTEEKKIIDLSIGNINGDIWITPSKNKSKKELDLYFLSLISIYLDIQIKNGQIRIHQDNKEVQIKNINFYEKENHFYIEKPVDLIYDTLSISVQNFSGKVQEADRIYIDELKITGNNIYFDTKGFYHFDGDFHVSGTGKLKNFKTEDIYIGELNLEINLSELDRKLSGSVNYTLSEGSFKNVDISQLNGNLRFNYADFLSGINNIHIKKTLYNNLKINNLQAISKIELKGNNIITNNTISLEQLFFKNIYLNNIKSNFSFKKEDFYSVEGKVYLDKLNVEFSSKISKTEKFINISVPETHLSDVLSYIPQQKNLKENLKLRLKGKINVDLIENKINSSFDLRKINIYGLIYEKGKISANTDINSLISDLNITLSKENGYLHIGGVLKKDSLDTDLYFENLDLNQLVFTNQIDIKGLVSGSGKLSGRLHNLTASINGNITAFAYKNLQIKKLNFNFSYKQKEINITAYTPDKHIHSDLLIAFDPFKTKININTEEGDLQITKDFLRDTLPVIFDRITPLKGSGNIRIVIEKNRWDINIDLPYVKVYIDPAEDYVYSKILGNISNRGTNLSVYFFKKGFNLKGKIIKDISGNVGIINEKGSFQLKITGLQPLTSFNLFLNGTFNTKEKKISGDIFSSLEKNQFRSVQNLNFYGSFTDISGVLFNEIYIKDKKLSENFINYSIDFRNNLKLKIFTKNLKIFITEKSDIVFENIKGIITIPQGDFQKTGGYISSNGLKIFKNKIVLTETEPFQIKIKDMNIYTKNVNFDGVISGNIDILSYDLNSQKLFLSSSGKIKKQLISEIIQFGSAMGSIDFYIGYNGNLENPLRKITVSLLSQDLRLKTPYTRDIISYKKLKAEIIDGKLDLDLHGATPSTLFGESFISIKGKSFIETFRNKYEIKMNMLPIKYSNIYVGNVNSNLKISSEQKEKVLIQIIDGEISLTGRVRLDQTVIQSIQGKKEKKTVFNRKKTLEKTILKKVLLNISASTYSPVYIYGNWGNAYGEGRINITGYLSSPTVNGELNIIYGKINYMKNRYNIDYANINVINNEAYINARLSTSVAETFIFINIYGSVKKPRIDFSSSPPKSRDEILSILLLKDTPAALENIPLIKTLGKIIYAVIPFKETEEKGLFNTGFEVLLNPQYSPSQGITASIYAKRPLTRRIYIALSKPLNEAEEFQTSGWYELGIKITERTSIQLRSFETGERELNINFSLPFDF
ncbi:translocation/assembly module TamB domain-containing protein [Persephonella sp.]